MSNNIQTLSTNEMSIAESFHKSGYFKDVNSQARAIVKMQAGKELGLGAFASMNGIDIIQGQIRLNANMLASLVKGSDKYNFRVKELDTTKCIIEFFEGKDSIGVSEYTIKEAQAAGLANRDNWKKHPKNMLYARAMSNGVKWFCPDVTSIKVYTDGDDDLPPSVNVDNSGIESLKEEAEEPMQVEVVEDEPPAKPPIANDEFEILYEQITVAATIDELKSYFLTVTQFDLDESQLSKVIEAKDKRKAELSETPQE